MSNLNCVRPRDEDEDSDIDEPEEEKPFLKMAGIKHAGCVNRVKYTKIGELTLLCTMQHITLFWN